MTINVAEALWLRLQFVLKTFAEGICTIDSRLICNVGSTANDSFLLRGYLTFSRHADGDEVAVTVDARGSDHQLIIESDACTDDGTIISVGPPAAVLLQDSQYNVEIAIEAWVNEFERWLQEIKSDVMIAVDSLTSK